MPKQQLTKHKCGAHIITALARHRAAIPLTLDPYPLNPTGEAAALKEGRHTYQARDYGQGRRRAHHIRQQPAGQVTVLTSHRCDHPIPQDSPAVRHMQMNKAVKICRDCPVMDRCRDYAMTLARREPIHGVWGGLRPSEINKLVRGRVK